MSSFLPRGTDTSDRKAQFSLNMCAIGRAGVFCFRNYFLEFRVSTVSSQVRVVRVSLLKKLNCFITGPSCFVLVG